MEIGFNITDHYLFSENFYKDNLDKLTKDYIYNSEEIRRDLLSGILDAIGNPKRTGKILVKHPNKHFIEFTTHLCRSLGMTVYTNNRVQEEGIIIIADDSRLLKSSKKAELSNIAKSHLVKVRSVVYMGELPAFCVTVDHESHLHLIEEYVVTHNSNKVIYEEFGAFKQFLDTWQTALPNVQEGPTAFGQAWAIGTGGSEGSDFYGALEMIRFPEGYNVYALPNLYDKGATGQSKTIFFYPSFLNLKGHYNKDGVSDVIGAILAELQERHKLKYNSSDPIMLSRRKAEFAFTITDAIMRRDSNVFPADQLNDRILELDSNPKNAESLWVGRLIQDQKGVVTFAPDTALTPITKFPHKDNKLEGAVIISKMPELDSSGKPTWGRYCAGIDPYDNDQAETLSLGAIYVFDLFTDEIVCEYVGRPAFAADFYEICRRMLIFYNAQANYENNKKGLFTYFSQHNSLYLLTDAFDYLKDKDLIKGSILNNTHKGTTATKPIQSYGRRLLRDWLLKPFKIVSSMEVDGEEVEVDKTVNSINKCFYRALMQELAMWNIDGNFDRYDALLMVMLLREHRLISCGTTAPSEHLQNNDSSYLGNDDFFTKNYDQRLRKID